MTFIKSIGNEIVNQEFQKLSEEHDLAIKENQDLKKKNGEQAMSLSKYEMNTQNLEKELKMIQETYDKYKIIMSEREKELVKEIGELKIHVEKFKSSTEKLTSENINLRNMNNKLITENTQFKEQISHLSIQLANVTPMMTTTSMSSQPSDLNVDAQTSQTEHLKNVSTMNDTNLEKVISVSTVSNRKSIPVTHRGTKVSTRR